MLSFKSNPHLKGEASEEIMMLVGVRKYLIALPKPLKLTIGSVS